MATALATAGLLAGIFGSTLAPVAQASGVNVKKIWASLTDTANVYDDWYDYKGDTPASGATSYPDGDPWVIYAPVYNDGLADTGSISYAACSGVIDNDIEDLAGNNLSDDNEVFVEVSATGGALVSLYANGGGYSNDYADWSVGSTSFEAGTGGFDVCVTAPDDDSSFASTITVKVNGAALKPIYAVIVGPAQTMTLQDKTIAAGTLDTHGWIAMDNNQVDYAARLRVFDKQGANMVSWLYDKTEIEDYAISGYESAGYGIEYIIGNPANGSDFTTDVEEGAALKKVDANANFCDSATDDTGDLKTITPVWDYDFIGTLSTPDKKQTAGAITLGCSADGSEAFVSGLDFGQATTVAAGDVTSLFIRMDDGYGNRLGLGTTFGLNPGLRDSRPFYYNYEIDSPAGLMPTPSHFYKDSNTDTEAWLDDSGALFEYEYQGVEGGGTAVNNTCSPTWGDEDYYAPSGGDDLTDYMNTTDDAAGAGSVRVCYYASQIPSDLGVNSVKMPLYYPYDDSVFAIYGSSQVTYKASITVTADNGAPLGAAVKVGKKTVSITGAIGSKVTFVVENSAGVVKNYTRIVGADGKAKFVFKVKGTFDVYAMQGDSMTDLARITVKL